MPRSVFVAFALLFGAGCAEDSVCAPEGRLCTVAGVLGSLGYNGDGPALDTELFFPSSLAFDADGQVVFADFNNMRIRMVDGGEVRTLAGTGVHAYAVAGAQPLDCPLENPVDVAVGAEGALHIAELHAGRVLRVEQGGRVEVVAGSGEVGFGGDGGPAADASLSESWGVDVAADGTVYIADTDNHVIRVVGADGILRTLAGVPETPGFADGAPGALNQPYRVRVDGDRLLVADLGNHAVRAVDRATGALTTLLGDGLPGTTDEGATAGRLNEPHAVRPTADGGFVVADSGNHVVRHVDAHGAVWTVAGVGERGRRGDGGPVRRAPLNYPADVLPDGDGGIYIADMLNGAVRHVGGALP